ncbi:MAG: NAD-dependent DNA ligase LigA [Candidatus Paceibacterota bacterium]|jgi:DNA ligase (NAD+)
MKKNIISAADKKRIENLEAQIADLRHRYHVKNEPGVTDEVYDSLTKELKVLQAKYPAYKMVSEIDRVAGKALSKFSKVMHAVRMLSLNDVFSPEELKAWEIRVKKLLPAKTEFEYFCELKFDGLAVSLIYENGIFVRGSTRGDGFIGEDITENLKMIKSIPLSLTRRGVGGEVPSFIEVRGEAVMSKKTWAMLNKKQEKLGLPLFANTRNAAAGSLRQLDSALTKERLLDFFGWDIAQIKDSEITNYELRITKHSEEHALLRRLGFVMDPHERVCKNIDQVLKFIDEIQKIRADFPYGTDGVVISVNELKLQEYLGVIGKAPRYMSAYKYPAERATTIVKDIRVNVGRTGVLTPLAIFLPTIVAGSTISKATLHNMDQIERLDLHIGDTIVIQKAGDVIPEVVEVLPKMRTGKEKKFKMPARCPVCNSAVEKRETGSTQSASVAYYCTNKSCPAKNRRGLQHFVNAFEIYEVGPKVLDRFKDEGLITDATDLFTLKKSDIESLPRFGEKSAENIIASIQSHKNVSLARFLYALGILHIGEETSRDLAEHFGTLEKIMKASLDEINHIPNIGDVVAKSVYNYFHQKENLSFVEKLKKNGVIVAKQIKTTGKLTGKIFVLTGTLDEMSRDEAKKKIQALGGKVGSAVSKETDYLVSGAEPGSKFKDAQKIGVKILNEQEFLKML